MRKQVQSPTSHGAKLGSPVRGEPEGRRDGATVAEPPWQASPRGAREEPEGAVAGPAGRAARGTGGRQPEESGESEGPVVPRAGAGEPGGLDKQKLSALDLFSPPVTRGNIIGKKRIKSDTSRVPVGGGGTSGGRQTVLGWLSVASELKPAIQSSGVLHLVFTSPRLNCLRSSSSPPPSFVRA